MGSAPKDRGLGWLRKYLEYTSKNEAPEMYHLWSGLTALAHVLGRNVWMDRGYFKTYPGTMMTILVGPAATRKSTAVGLATSLVKDIPVTKIISEKLSAQTLIDQMDRGYSLDRATGLVKPADAVAFISATELSVFIPKAQYIEELIPLLTKLFDAEDKFEYSTRTHGTVILTNPLITLLGASTPDWLAQSIPESSYGGGFMSRIFFVFQNKSSKRNPRPERDPQLHRQRDELLAELLWISNNMHGEAIIDPSAYADWDLFYENSQNNPNLACAGFIGGYFGRRAEHTLRVAICLAVASRHELVVTARDIRYADIMLKQLENEMPGAFEQFGASSLSQQQQKILDFLQTTGPMRMMDLYKKFWRFLNKQEFGLAVDSLVQAGLVDPPYLVGKTQMIRPMSGIE